MHTYQTKLLRIGEIAGIYYYRQKSSQNLLIYGPGAPIVPDSGNLPDATAACRFDIDIFVPDYIGYGRSAGVITPQSCIDTFTTLNQKIRNGVIACNSYENINFKLQYSRIIFAGRSFGGSYVPLLPKHDPSITDLCLIYPAVDNKSCGTRENEESNDDFMRAMNDDGYKYLYRGIDKPLWKAHLNNEDGLSPMDNIKYLDKAKVFIGHGKTDKCISYQQSVVYFQKLTNHFKHRQKQFKLNLYEDTGHEPATSNQAITDCLNWFNIKRYN